MSRDLHADAEESKTKGNDCLNKKDFDTAISWYTQALDFAKHLPAGQNNRHVYYSNRSAAYLSKGFADSALKDADACIKEKPDWPKGYGRKGAALHFSKKYDQALQAYDEGLAVAPGDASLIKGREEVEADKKAPSSSYARPPGGGGGGQQDEMMNQLFQVFADPKAGDVLRNNAKTKAFMEDAQFVSTLELLQTNPSLISQLMNSDKRFLTALTVLMGMEMPQEEDEEVKKARKAKAEEERRVAEEAKKRAEESPEDRMAREALEAANALKEEGNILYKKRDFPGALAKYQEALNVCPREMTFWLNMASVYMETKDFAQALEACDRALEVGRTNGAKYEQMARAHERKGNVLAKENKWDLALQSYQRAQLEFRTSAVDDRIHKIEKQRKAQEELEYVNPELGQTANAKGHELLASGKFPESIVEFTDAVKRDPTNAQYRVDRSLAYTKVMDFGRAQEDVERALELNPTLVPAFARKGKIETFTKRYNRALDSFRKGLELDPQSEECRTGLRHVEELIQKQSRSGAAAKNSRGEMDEDERVMQQRAMEDPEIRSILQDPVMQQVLRDLGSDPQAARKHLSNPDVARKIEKLIAAGIVKTG